MCCVYWQKMIEKRFCFCTTQSLTVMLYGIIVRSMFCFNNEALNRVTKPCNMSSAKFEVYRSSRSYHIREIYG